MQNRPIRHRRARRADFDALAALLGGAGITPPADDRAGRSRFRRIVADLGSDLYVATIDDVICGLAHVTYTRPLVGPPSATLEMLAVAVSARRLGVGSSLVAFMNARASRRGCGAVTSRGIADEGASAFLRHLRWRNSGEQLVFDLTPGAG